MMRVFALWVLMAGAALAVQPDEILDDPALEERARELSAELRCLVCRNESIDESNAELARDLRLLVRERLVAGDTNAQVMDYIVARYGEYVLLSPQKTGSTLILWLAGPAALLFGGGLAFVYTRSRRAAQADQALSDEEQARVREILGD